MIRAGTGGQTRALLMRNRLLAQHAGIEPTLLTFDQTRSTPRSAPPCAHQGQLVAGMQLLNIYEWYRTTMASTATPPADPLPDLEGSTPGRAPPRRHGLRTKYLSSARACSTRSVHDYRRPTARSTCAPRSGWSPTRRRPRRASSVDGRCPHPQLGAQGWLAQAWLRTLAGDAERVFVISDSRYALAHILPMPTRASTSCT